VIGRGGKIQHLFVDLNVLPAYSFTPVKKKSNERTDPFSFFSSPTQSFLPLYFSQAALFKKQKNSTLTQCVALKVIIKHGNLS